MTNESNDDNIEFVDKINSLIKKSFGYFYKGNYKIIGGTDGSLQDHNLNPNFEKNSLEFIAKPLLLDPAFGCGVAGLIGNGGENRSDGSVIVIRKDKKKYIRGAEKYAQLYKENFDKDVQIIYVDNFNELIRGIGLCSGSPFPKDFGFKSGD